MWQGDEDVRKMGIQVSRYEKLRSLSETLYEVDKVNKEDALRYVSAASESRCLVHLDMHHLSLRKEHQLPSPTQLKNVPIPFGRTHIICS